MTGTEQPGAAHASTAKATTRSRMSLWCIMAIHLRFSSLDDGGKTRTDLIPVQLASFVVFTTSQVLVPAIVNVTCENARKLRLK